MKKSCYVRLREDTFNVMVKFCTAKRPCSSILNKLEKEERRKY